jgi:phosphoribosylpyrophosphate synthetase
MMLVGDVRDRTAILIDDLADTSNTITRAAKLLKKEGASKVYALVTHGILSGDAIERINASSLDKVVVTNSVDQSEHLRRCPKLEVLEVGHVFAEVSQIRRNFVDDATLHLLTAQPARPFAASTTVKASAFCSSTIDFLTIMHERN